MGQILNMFHINQFAKKVMIVIVRKIKKEIIWVSIRIGCPIIIIAVVLVLIICARKRKSKKKDLIEDVNKVSFVEKDDDKEKLIIIRR